MSTALIELSGTVISPLFGPLAAGLFSQTEGAGQGGNLVIQTARLSVRDGAQVSTSASGEGKGGFLAVTASDFIELIGTSANGVTSGLFSNTEGAGDAENLTISTANLTARDGAQVSTRISKQIPAATI